MRESLGSYVLASPLDEGAGIETRNATSIGESGRARPVRLDALWVGPGLSEQLSARFAEDAEAAARLPHKTFGPLLDHGIDAGFAYIVYEPYVCVTLAELLERSQSGRLQPELAVALFADLAEGLVAAHGMDRALVHRGIDPLSVRVDSSGRARLHGHALSGLAQGMSRARAAAWDRPQYLSPEILQDGPITAQTDLFCLGSTLYEALCGHAAFGASNPGAASMKVRMGSYASLDEVAPELAPELRALVAGLLSADPSKRPLAEAARDTLSALSTDASAHRREAAASMSPSARTPAMPSVQTEPAVATPEIAAPALHLGDSAPTGRRPIEDTVDLTDRDPLRGPVFVPDGHMRDLPTFETFADPTLLDRSSPEPAAAPPLLDGPTLHDPRSLAAAFGLETEELTAPPPAEPPTALTIALPMASGEQTHASLGQAPIAEAEADAAPGARLALIVIAAGATAIVIVLLGVLLAVWLHS